MVNQPKRPMCRRHKKNDCDLCRGASKQNFGEEFSKEYFGDTPLHRDTSIRPAGRTN